MEVRETGDQGGQEDVSVSLALTSLKFFCVCVC